MLNFFNKKLKPRKSEAEWRQALVQLPDGQLKNIVNNPGEFVVEMRQAAVQILRERTVT